MLWYTPQARKFRKMVITRSAFCTSRTEREHIIVGNGSAHLLLVVSFQMRASTTSRRRWRFLWASLQKWWCARWEMPRDARPQLREEQGDALFGPKKNNAATVYARVCNYAYEKCALRKGEERAAVSDRIAFEESPIYGLMLFARIKIFPPVCFRDRKSCEEYLWTLIIT